jgi:asparagine synthase (glutamine-hydrolysing)
MLALARMARKHVAVALSGDGGDELLAGYTRYRLNSTLGRVFDGSLGGLATACGAVLNKAWPDDVRGYGLVRLLTPGGDARYRRLVSDSWLAKQSIVGRSDLTAFTSAWDDGAPGLANRMCKADLRLYLPEDLMTKVDRTCMAVGLEPRAPFLDRALFEFVGAAPTHMKGYAGDAKRPLKQIVGHALGTRFAARDKQGFAVPLGHWFRNELRDMVGDTLGGSATFVGQLFPPGFGQKLLEAHIKGSRDMSTRLWMLLVLQRWHNRFGGSITNEAAPA